MKDAARRAGIPGRRHSPRPADLDDGDWLRTQLEATAPTPTIATELVCSEEAVRQAVTSHELGDVARRRRQFAQLYDDGWLRAAVVAQSRREVAVQVGCSVEAVGAAERRLERPACA